MITIRKLSADDYDTICAVWRASGLSFRPRGRDSRENFLAQMASGLQTVLGAEVDGTLVGVVLTTHDGRKGWINRLGVVSEFQRRGIGRALIQAAEETLRAQGMSIIAVLIEHDNQASLALFQAAGYHLDDTYYLTKRDRPDV